MEKFRAFLEVLKKYHFWVLCGLIVLLSFVTWFLAIGAQTKQFLARKTEIDGKFKLDEAISQNREHPSRSYIDQLNAITVGPLTKQVETASNRLYNEQRAANPLPVVFPGKDDQKGFEDAFESIWGRMEEIEKLPPDKLPEFYRSRYRDHIAEYFPHLFKLIERREQEENADNPNPGVRGQAAQHGLSGFGGADAAGDEKKRLVGIVDWDDAEQKIKSFTDRYTLTAPNTLDIMMAQEELWVYETLLKVVRNTNDMGSDQTHRDPKQYRVPTSHKVARIKKILAMDIGRDAVQNWTSCEKALINLASEAVVGQGGVAPPPMVAPPAGRGGGGPSTGTGGSPLAGRYVDDKGKPLTDPTQQPFNEFRMMPITLKVIIEQKEIPRLLAECANSAMRIDVRSVRILIQQPSPVDPAAPEAPSAAGGETKAAGHGFGGLRPGAMGGRGGGFGGDTGGSGESAYDEESADPVYPPVPVEVHGIIYIYNPPANKNAGEKAADNSNAAVANGVPAGNTAVPANNAAVPGVTAPATPAANTTSPAPVAPPVGPAATGAAVHPSINKPASGGRP